eukprot:697347-Pyramimonas_sp.AAC.1
MIEARGSRIDARRARLLRAAPLPWASGCVLVATTRFASKVCRIRNPGWALGLAFEIPSPDPLAS